MLKILFINLLLPTALISTPVIAASGIFVAIDNNPIKVEEKIILEEPKPFNKEKIEKNLSELKEKLEEGLKSGLKKLFSCFKDSVASESALAPSASVPPVLPEPDIKVLEEKDAEVKKIPKLENKPKEAPKIDSITNDIDVKPNKKLEELHWTDLTQEGKDIVLGVYKDFNDYARWWEHRITDKTGKWFQTTWDYVEDRKWNWPELDGHKIILIPETLNGQSIKLSLNTNSAWKAIKPDFASNQDQEWRLYFQWPYYTSSYYEDRLRIGYDKQIQKKQPKPEIVELDNLD